MTRTLQAQEPINLPSEIKDAINKGNLAIFVGAGVSRLIGCDGWSDLANSLVNLCYENELIDHKEKEVYQ